MVNNVEPPLDDITQSSRRTWMPRMEFPRFNGEGVRMWIDNCEAYFLLYNIPANFRIMSASLHLMDNAADWYQSVKFTDVCTSWDTFCAAALDEFDVNVHRNCMRELLVLKQTGTVQEYRSSFNRLVYKVRLYEGIVSDTLLVTRFILGLKEELRAVVEIQLPNTVHAATQYALVQEGLLARSKAMGKFQRQIPARAVLPRGEPGPKPQFAAGDVWKARQLKEYRRANGLCYSCGEKYIPGHVCPDRQGAQVKAIETEEDGVILSDAMLDAIAGEEALEDAAAFLTVNAVAGTSHSKSIKIRALVGTQVMLLLVDSGSSHTFIDQQLVARLNCKTEALPKSMRVRVANGQFLHCNSEVKQLEWWSQDTTFATDMKVIPLGGYDAILGMDWLSMWGEMTCHWQDRWLRFQKDGKTVTLQGMQDTTVANLTEITVEQVEKSYKGNDVWATVVVSTTDPVTQEPVPACIQATLAEFADGFADPKDLPPHRAFDHAISLLPDSAPVNSRPYRYSPQQKDEIERQVNEMIAAGLITPSMSPFASPVLLVKKKDGTWRFCVDYRRLNNITIKRKFPIPVVDELLDELAGTKWFSKLDLRAGYHQIRMVEKDEAKTAFKTHHGQFQFRVMPFGLTNAPATFQCLMNSVFAKYIRKCVLVFMDDILVYSKDLETHQLHLQMVLDILRENKLYAKLSKCSFA